MKRRVFRAGVPALLLAGLVGAPHVAHAFPQEEYSTSDPDWWCVDNVHTWSFEASWNSYPDSKTWAEQGINGWNGPLDYDGAQLIDVTKVSAGTGDVKVSIVPQSSLGTGVRGRAGCNTSGGYIYISQGIITDAAAVRKVARHEMGHLLGMAHSGQYESLDVPSKITPTMSTCNSDDATSLAMDDEAYANWLHSKAAYNQLNANYGFEEGFTHWQYEGGVLETQTTGGAGGPRRIRHRTVTAASYVHQTVRIATGNDDARYRVVMQYKVDAMDLTGFVEATAYRRRIDFSSSANGCSYADGLVNLNSSTLEWATGSSDGYIAMVSTGHETVLDKTSWTKATSVWYDPANADGYQLDLRVHSHADDATGANRWVYLDNLRIEGCDTCT